MTTPKHLDGWEGPYHIVTQSGVLFDYRLARPEHVCIEDIAHALSHLCRFTGHCDRFYSVAQHSLLCANQIGGSPELQLYALLHDAHEAYLNDLSSPLKKLIGGTYAYLAERLDQTIHDRFRLPLPAPESVKRCDRIALVYEWEAFFPHMGREESQKLGMDMDLSGSWTDGPCWRWDPHQYAIEMEGEFMRDVRNRFITRFRDLMKRSDRGDLL